MELESIIEDIIKYVPHELRTPLSQILGFSEYLSTEFEALKKEEVKDISDSINYAGQRLMRTIEKYLTYVELTTLQKSRLVSSKIDIDEEFIFDVVRKNNLLVTAIHLMDCDIDPVSICINQNYFIMLLNEIIENAVKFSEQGERIKISSYNRADKYCINVYNKGVGLTEEEIDNISVFRQFDRCNNNQQGNGLGLVIVKKIINLMGGYIFIESVKNSFMNVRICIPISKADSE